MFDAYRKRLQGEEPKWYTVSWLFAECYMYRKINEILRGRYIGGVCSLHCIRVQLQQINFSLVFPSSTYLQDFDPFAAQKESGITGSLQQITALGSYLTRLVTAAKQDSAELRAEFEHLLLVSGAFSL